MKSKNKTTNEDDEKRDKTISSLDDEREKMFSKKDEEERNEKNFRKNALTLRCRVFNLCSKVIYSLNSFDIF